MSTSILFEEEFVERGSLEPRLLTEARAAQAKRERADYEAWLAPREEAQRVIAPAGRFLAAVGKLLGEAEDA